MIKAGILGGGQLGRMMLQAAANYPVETWVLENDPHCPSAHLCNHFVKGNITDYDAVYNFGKSLDVLTIEIEHVNVDALETLEKEGKKIFPKPSVLRIINNKAFQKTFYRDNNIPSPEFKLLNTKQELEKHLDFLPAVQKLQTGGYDGKGVQVLNSAKDFEKAFEAASVLEKKVFIKKEVAIIIAVDQNGKTAIYPPVEMIFNKDLNLLDYQICPADLSKQVLWKVEAIALSAVRAFQSAGLYAIEMFITDKDDVMVNETAPRVHNSGHHTIEAHYSSQFDMLWRILLNFPLGSTQYILPSTMINIIGSMDAKGIPDYCGIEEVLEIEQAFVHIYGKEQVKPGRKMGHITIMGSGKQDLIFKANKIKNTITVNGV